MVLSQQPCNEIIPLLDAFLDEELSASEKNVVQAHLSGCSECSARLATIATLVNSLRSLPRAEMSRDITELVPRSGGNLIAFKPRVWAAVGVAATVALVALAAINGRFTHAPVVADKTDHTNQNAPALATQDAPVVAPHQPITGTNSQLAQNSSVAVKPQKPVAGTNANVTTGNGTPVKPQIAATPHQRASDASNNDVHTGHKQQQAPAAVANSSNMVGVTQDSMEVAVLNDDGGLSDALGIATDEDGLYELKM